MKRILLASLAPLLLSMTAPDGPEPEFTLSKADGNIRIYSRWIPVDETRSARQLKAEFTVESTPDRILSVLREERSLPDWMQHTETCYRVRSLGPGDWYSYIRFDVPWPLSNQDCILHYEVMQSGNGESIRVKGTGVPDFMRSFEGVKRIGHLEIEWILTRVGEGRTRVEYKVFSNLTPSFPRKITDPIIQNNLMDSMNAFRDLFHKKPAS